MNDVLIQKTAHSVRVGEFLLLQGETDWGDYPTIGSVRVREIKHHSEKTVTLLCGEAWPGSTVRLGLSDAEHHMYALMFEIDRSAILVRYSGSEPAPTCIIREHPEGGQCEED